MIISVLVTVPGRMTDEKSFTILQEAYPSRSKLLFDLPLEQTFNLANVPFCDQKHDGSISFFYVHSRLEIEYID